MGYALTAKALSMARLAGGAATMESAMAANASRNLLRRIYRGGFPAKPTTWDDALAKYGPDWEAIIRGAGRSDKGWNALGINGYFGGLCP